MKLLLKIICFCLFVFFVSNFSSCKKDKFITDSGAKVEFSQDSVLFDTVFTTIGSATQNIRIRNKHSQKIKISSIQLQGGSSSQFIVNVDGAKGTSFSNLEIAANDSMYIFIQVNVNPTNANSPLIIEDALNFVVNGNQQKVVLEAWGQDAYYHRPDSVIKQSDGSYFYYSVANAVPNSYNLINGEIVWKNDKPHVVYGWLVIDGPETNAAPQKLKIQAGTQVYMNYKAGIWVYAGGQIQVLGEKGKEVVFQGARREKDYADDPGQWDRIWINEGSDDNIIDYAIIKNAYIGIQCEFAGDTTIGVLEKKGQLTLTNTKIQNMSYWGLYCNYYKVFGGNNVISNCQEYCLNILNGGGYYLTNCTFANYWGIDKVRDKSRDKPTININNYNVDPNTGQVQILSFNVHIGNCIIDGNLDNELSIDIKKDITKPASAYVYAISNCWIKTNINTSDSTIFMTNVIGDKNANLNYKDRTNYNFEPASENRVKNFTSTLAQSDVKLFPTDINGISRDQNNVTAGAYGP